MVDGPSARRLHVAERPAHDSALLSGILALCNQPWWHDKLSYKVVCGKGQQRSARCDPPGTLEDPISASQKQTQNPALQNTTVGLAQSVCLRT